MKNLNLKDLSIELLQKIIQYLTPKDMRSIRCSSKLLYEITNYFIKNEKWLDVYKNKKCVLDRDVVCKIYEEGVRFMKIDNNYYTIVNMIGIVDPVRKSYQILTRNGRIVSCHDLDGTEELFNQIKKTINFSSLSLLEYSKNNFKRKKKKVSYWVQRNLGGALRLELN